jgi:ElaB/YqjD/DUF883 family membrane-anchored ribosome-binding protein
VLVCQINGNHADVVFVNVTKKNRSNIQIGDKMPDQVKTDVEILKRDMELLAGLAEKFDDAIERLADISTSVDKMLAVHEMRLQNQEQQREIIHQRISDMKKEMTDEFRLLRDENRQQHSETNERLAKLERWRWFVVGVATVIGFLVAQMPDLSKLFQ